MRSNIETSPLAQSQGDTLCINPAEMRNLQPYLTDCANSTRELLISLDYDDTILDLERASKLKLPIINQSLVIFLADLLCSHPGIYFKFIILSARSPDQYFKSNFRYGRIDQGLPLFLDELNAALKNRHSDFQVTLNADAIYCMGGPIGYKHRKYFVFNAHNRAYEEKSLYYWPQKFESRDQAAYLLAHEAGIQSGTEFVESASTNKGPLLHQLMGELGLTYAIHFDDSFAQIQDIKNATKNVATVQILKNLFFLNSNQERAHANENTKKIQPYLHCDESSTEVNIRTRLHLENLLEMHGSNDHGRSNLLNAMPIELIKNHTDFNRLLKHQSLSEQDRNIILGKFIEQLPRLILGIHHMHETLNLESLSDNHKASILTSLTNEIPDLIASETDLFFILNHKKLNDNHRTILLTSLVKKKCFKITNANDLFDYFCMVNLSASNVLLILEIFQEQGVITENPRDIFLLLNSVQHDNHSVLRTLMLLSESIKYMSEDEDVVHALFQFSGLEDNHRDCILNILLGSISLRLLIHIASCYQLTLSAKHCAINRIIELSSSQIYSPDDLIEALDRSIFSKANRDSILKAVIPKLPNLITTTGQFFLIMSSQHLNDEHRSAIIRASTGKLSGIFLNLTSILKIFNASFLSENIQRQLFGVITPYLSICIQSSEDLKSFWFSKHTDSDQLEVIWRLQPSSKQQLILNEIKGDNTDKHIETQLSKITEIQAIAPLLRNLKFEYQIRLIDADQTICYFFKKENKPELLEKLKLVELLMKSPEEVRDWNLSEKKLSNKLCMICKKIQAFCNQPQRKETSTSSF